MRDKRSAGNPDPDPDRGQGEGGGIPNEVWGWALRPRPQNFSKMLGPHYTWSTASPVLPFLQVSPSTYIRALLSEPDNYSTFTLICQEEIYCILL